MKGVGREKDVVSVSLSTAPAVWQVGGVAVDVWERWLTNPRPLPSFFQSAVSPLVASICWFLPYRQRTFVRWNPAAFGTFHYATWPAEIGGNRFDSSTTHQTLSSVNELPIKVIVKYFWRWRKNRFKKKLLSLSLLAFIFDRCIQIQFRQELDNYSTWANHVHYRIYNYYRTTFQQLPPYLLFPHTYILYKLTTGEKVSFKRAAIVRTHNTRFSWFPQNFSVKHFRSSQRRPI